MNDENVFRWAVLALIASTMPIGIYHRLRAERPDERISRRGEGPVKMIALRLCGLSNLVSLLLYLFNPQSMQWWQLALPGWLRWAGIGLGVASIPLFVWVFRSLGTNVTDTVVVRREHYLVQHGPYRRVRHPMYLMFATYFLAVSLATASWFFATMGVLALLLIAWRTPIEESNLIARYGDQYRDYMRRTGRFFPRLKTVV
jgi:protein-S-isoprenylcysteine O-methyltransferase Ste14